MSHVIIGKDNYSQMICCDDSFLTIEKNGENFYLTSALDVNKKDENEHFLSADAILVFDNNYDVIAVVNVTPDEYHYVDYYAEYEETSSKNIWQAIKAKVLASLSAA